MRTTSRDADRILDAVEAARDEIVACAVDLVRVPTVNPPGNEYAACAEVVARWLRACQFDVSYHVAVGRPEHSAAYPRVNVVGRRGTAARPCVHVNGHIDVVPVGQGWSVDPFGGLVRDGRLYGRGACDMKAGLAAAIFAAEALRRAGVAVDGSLEISATVDEESGGWAGVAWLAEQGLLARQRVDYVIIPEPLNVDRICVGHRGVYWCEIATHGRIAHGSMPFLGTSAISHMAAVLEAVRLELEPRLRARTTAMPVVPDAARHATVNVNAVIGGQAGEAVQTPCVADRCAAILDRRFLLEEGFAAARGELVELLDALTTRIPGLRYELRDLMIVEPVHTPASSPLVTVLRNTIAQVLGREATLVASPGTYDHKHVSRIGKIEDCVAYGPGILDLAHQPDEWCGVDDLVNATRVLALTLHALVEGRTDRG
jgi:succinyl-diaminopimelate desuccinylase